MMISRSSIYDYFIDNVDVNINIILDKISYYNNRLTMSNSKLEVYWDSLSRCKSEFLIIYDININRIKTDPVRVNYINKTVIDSRNGIKSMVGSLRKLDNSNGMHTVIFVKGVASGYITITNEIININRKLQLLNDKLSFYIKYKNLSKNIVFYILSKCNKYYEQAILNGETIHLGHNIGFIKVVPKKAKGKTNWDESFKYRDRLLAEGKLPYNKADFEKAKAANKPYDGVKWFVRYENEVQHYINWYNYSVKLPNRKDYSFSPARYNKTDKTIKQITAEVVDINELDNYHIGIVNKLNIGLEVNDLQFIKYARYDI